MNSTLNNGDSLDDSVNIYRPSIGERISDSYSQIIMALPRQSIGKNIDNTLDSAVLGEAVVEKLTAAKTATIEYSKQFYDWTKTSIRNAKIMNIAYGLSALASAAINGYYTHKATLEHLALKTIKENSYWYEMSATLVSAGFIGYRKIREGIAKGKSHSRIAGELAIIAGIGFGLNITEYKFVRSIIIDQLHAAGMIDNWAWAANVSAQMLATLFVYVPSVDAVVTATTDFFYDKEKFYADMKSRRDAVREKILQSHQKVKQSYHRTKRVTKSLLTYANGNRMKNSNTNQNPIDQHH